MKRYLLAMASFVALSGAAFALSPEAQRGYVFVNTNCSGCHAIGPVGDSPLPIAPPFRTLHEKYPVDDLRESFAEGIYTGHPTMPEFELDVGQIDDVISYLKSLERSGD
jgi:cytochrome c